MLLLLIVSQASEIDSCAFLQIRCVDDSLQCHVLNQPLRSQVNAISESQATDELKGFLELNLPKVQSQPVQLSWSRCTVILNKRLLR